MGVWQWSRRVAGYLAGVACVSLGIVFCKKCGLGISPISSIPFVLEDVVPLTFGTLTMLFHFVNTALQLILKKRLFDTKILLQVFLAMLFGVVIDFFNSLIAIDGGVLAWRLVSLALSIFFTAFGMLLMLRADLIQNPPDGAVKLIAELTGRSVGGTKVLYDWGCVAISVLIGVVFLRRVEGFGVATVASALLVGRTLGVMQSAVGRAGGKNGGDYLPANADQAASASTASSPVISASRAAISSSSSPTKPER